MPLESAAFISQLNVANPTSTDTVSQADDHLRLIKSVLKTTFPNLDAPVTATPAQLNVPVPVGLIAMWSGAINAIPTGWRLCDGTNGTPDLRDRFIVGAGSSYAVGATGGANSVTLTEAQIPSHTHEVSATVSAAGGHNHTLTDPGHTHTVNLYYNGAGGNYPDLNGFTGSNEVVGEGTNDINTATTGITIQTAGEHTHTVNASAATTGGGQAHENRPPYFALAYIIKV